MLNRRKVRTSIILFKANTKKVVERYKDGASEDIKIQQHQLNRHIGKMNGQYIRTNSVLLHITAMADKTAFT